MKNSSDPRVSPNFTLGEIGLFPPFFGTRVDYIGWVVGRRYHLWLAIAVSAIIITISLNVWVDTKKITGLIAILIYICLYFLYNQFRRIIFRNYKRMYFSYIFQYSRALIAVLGVALLHVTLIKLSSDESLPIWPLYILVLTLASEYQHYSIRGYIGTLLLYLLVAIFVLLVILITQGADPRLLFSGFSKILIIWFISFGYHYLIQNIQKRSILFNEDNNYVRQLLETRNHVQELEEFWKVSLRICIHRLRANHGSIWLCHPASGRIEFKVGVYQGENGEVMIGPRDACDKTFYLDEKVNNIIERVAITKKSMWCAVQNHHPLKTFPGVEPIHFCDNHGISKELEYEMAAPVLDFGDHGDTIGIINVNFDPGHLKRLSQKWPFLFNGLRERAHKYVLDWQRDLLDISALQLSNAWEHSRLVYSFNKLLGRFPKALNELRCTKIADNIASSLSDSIGTTTLVFCYDEMNMTYVLNGMNTMGKELKVKEKTFLTRWISSHISDQPVFLPCPEFLIDFSEIINPMVLIIPLNAKQGFIGAVVLFVRNGINYSYIENDEFSIARTYLSQISYAVGNERLLRKSTEQTHALEIIHDITIEAMKSRDLDVFADNVRHLLESKLGYHRVHVGIVRDSSRVTFPTTDHVKHSPVILGGFSSIVTTAIEQVWRKPQSLIYLDKIQGKESPLGTNWLNAKSAIISPLLGTDGFPKGFLIVHDDEKTNAYTNDDIKLLTQLSSVLGLSLEQIIQNIQLQAIAGVNDIGQVISISLFSSKFQLHDALSQLVLNLHSTTFSEYSFLQIWKINEVNDILELVASSPKAGILEGRRSISLDTPIFKDAVENRAYCIDNLEEYDISNPLANGLPNKTKSACFVPLRAGSKNLGIMTLGFNSKKDFSNDLPFTLERIADDIGQAWFLRENLEDLASQTERLRILNETHNIALSSSQYALRGWGKMKAILSESGALSNNPVLTRSFEQLGNELTAVKTSIEIAVRGGKYAKTHDLGLIGAINDSITAKQLLYDGEKTIFANLDKLAGSKITLVEAEELFFIFESALSNALKNRSSNKIKVTLKENRGGDIFLEIQDDGNGFDYDLAKRDPGHFGLRSIEMSAQKIGWIFSAKYLSGTQIRVIKSNIVPTDKGP